MFILISTSIILSASVIDFYYLYVLQMNVPITYCLVTPELFDFLVVVVVVVGLVA
jgi:hypothetical protein